MDAVAADPPARQEIAGDVEAILPRHAAPATAGSPNAPDISGDVPAGFPPSRSEAVNDLRQQFLSWQHGTPALLELAAETPRLNDMGPLALELAQLGAVGTEALAYLDAHSRPPSEWHDHAQALLNKAQSGGALVHFVFLPSLERLVAAASAAPGQ